MGLGLSPPERCQARVVDSVARSAKIVGPTTAAKAKAAPHAAERRALIVVSSSSFSLFGGKMIPLQFQIDWSRHCDCDKCKWNSL